MLKKEINNIELSIETPYEIQLVNIPAGIYRLRIIHQSRAVFDRPRSLFFTFDIPGLTPQEIRDLLGLKDISAQNGVFAYAGGGEEKAGFYVQEVELNVTKPIESLITNIKTFLSDINILIDSFGLFPLLIKEDSLTSNFSAEKIAVSSLKRWDTNENDLEKSKPMVWNRFNIKGYKEVVVSVATIYKNIVDVAAKKALLLVKFYDSAKKEVTPKLLTGLSYSDKYKNYFIYLKNTKGQIEPAYKFYPADNIEFLEIGCLEFNLQDNEEVIFGDIRIDYYLKKQDTTPSKSTYSPRKVLSAIKPKDPTLRFISILDEISYFSWAYEFKLFEMSRTNYKKQIESSSSQGVFIESCWNGNFGNWLYAFTSPNLQHANAQALLSALDTANNRKLPVIFWNKEDPMHYDKFLPIAKKCNVIFTTDSNKVADYKRDIPEAKVEALPFAANIHLCNPKDRFRIKEPGTVCFAGSYYSVGHDDRKEQMDRLLPAIIECNGVIYDRMSNIEGDRYAYPPQYKEYTQPAVPFNEIIDVYKKFKIFLNVNTITDSPTMMSRRVYELLACGTPVISTPSLALEKQFPGIVQIADDAEEAVKIAQDLLADEWKWARLSHLGYREVMLKHTYSHRMQQIAKAIGVHKKEQEPLVTIAAVTNRPEFIDRLAKNIREQSIPRLELIFVLQNYSEEQIEKLKRELYVDGRMYEDTHFIIDESDSTLGARLNKAIEISKGDYLVKMDDDDFYFSNYIQDMLIPFSFGNYGIVGKKEIFIYLEEHDKTIVRYKNERHKETDFVAGATLVISREALNKLEFGDKNRGEDTSLLNQAKEKKIKIYAADPFNFIVWRGKNKNRHTWQVDDEFFMKNAEVVGGGISTNLASFKKKLNKPLNNFKKNNSRIGMKDQIDFDFLLPIGASCQTKYQLDRYLKKYFGINQPACFFDWLGLGGVKGVSKIVEDSFKLISSDLVIVSPLNNGSFEPYHIKSGFRFTHSFGSNEKNRKDLTLAEKALRENLEEGLKKADYLGARTDLILKSDAKVGLLYHGKIIESHLDMMFDSLFKKYHKKFTLINVMNKQDKIVWNRKGVVSLSVDNTLVKGLSNEWKGDDNSWDQALALLNLNNVPSFIKRIKK